VQLILSQLGSRFLFVCRGRVPQTFSP
jgi:hypothetical protein